MKFCETVLPNKDISEVEFTGDRCVRIIRALFVDSRRTPISSRALHLGVVAITLVILAPFAYIANRRALKRASFNYTPEWLNMFLRFSIVRREASHAAVITDSPDASAGRLAAGR